MMRATTAQHCPTCVCRHADAALPLPRMAPSDAHVRCPGCQHWTARSMLVATTICESCQRERNRRRRILTKSGARLEAV